METLVMALPPLSPRAVMDRMGLKQVSQATDYEWQASCPFHDDSQPSFYINVVKQVWNCYGCGKGGMLISLIRRLMNVDHLEAAMIIARMKPGKDTVQEPRVLRPIPETYLIQYAPLLGNDYTQRRRIGRQTLVDFDVRYDHEFNRVLVPIRDHLGRLNGYVEREIDPEKEPPYLYSTSVAKSLVLFNLNRLIARCDLVAVIAEGTMDVMRAYDAGFPFVVATLGSALSAEQAKLLKDVRIIPFLAFDNDKKGRLFHRISVARLRDLDTSGRRRVKVHRIRIPRHRKDLGDCTNNELRACLAVAKEMNQRG